MWKHNNSLLNDAEYLETIKRKIEDIKQQYALQVYNINFDNLENIPDDELQMMNRGSTVGFLLLQCSSGVVRHPRDLQVSVATRFCRVLIFASS